MMRAEVRTSVKRKAEEDLHTKPNKIIRREVSARAAWTILGHSDLKLLRKSAYECRRKKLPSLPKTRDEALQQLVNGAYKILHNGHQKLCHMYKGIPIFTTKENLRLLFQSQFIFGDGTFKHSPRFFAGRILEIGFGNRGVAEDIFWIELFTTKI